MAEPQTAAVTVESGDASPAALPSLLELIEAVATEQVAPAAAPPPAPGFAQVIKPGAPGFIDPLDEANFTAEKLATPEGIQAARDLLQAQVKEALNIRRAAHNARAEAERKETKLKHTRDTVLGEKQATAAQVQFLQRELQELQAGDPDRFITALGRVANAADPHAFWNKIAIALAKGKPVEAEAAKPSKEMEELRARQDRIEAERAAEITQREEQAILNLRMAQINDASTYTDLPYVHSLVNERDERGQFPQVPLIDARLVAIKRAHYEQKGNAIDTRTACGILENEIRSHFELLQRAGTPSGTVNGEKGVAAPVAGLAGKPELTAKPEAAPRLPIQTAVTAIPSALTASPAATKRALSEAEQREAKIAELDRLGLFSNLGM